MSFNATRLTCFALISAMESDCRTMILGLPVGSDWPAQARNSAIERAKREYGASSNIDDTVLINYLDFADSYEILLRHKGSVSPATAESLEAVTKWLQEMVAIRNRVAHTRPIEINDFSTLQDATTELARLAPDDWPSLIDTLHRLKQDPSYVLGLTIQLPSDPIRQPYHNLPFPDFDETGFYGRKQELRRIKKALSSAWPVVSIIGDGGIGKTSIALKAAYDILDDPSFSFDAVVWASAKATSLTTTEIVSISGAIQDSLGLFKVAANELGVPDSSMDDAVEELLQYLSSFRILLVLDNLETVADQRLRDFLFALPQGSKVLVTSRIGLGLENPVKLGPLSNEEGRRLLRALSSIRNVQVLKTLDEPGLNKFVKRLNGHPLYIKWLVSGVESGLRPSDILQNNVVFLDFCMSNVFERLSRASRELLQMLQVVQGRRGQAELAFISQMTAYEIQETLLELMKTNFVSMQRSNYDDLESLYQTEEFARQYLAKHQPVSSEFRSRVTARVHELSRIGRDLKSMQFNGRYDIRSIDTRGPHDMPAAKILVDAQRLVRQGSLDEALEMCREAQRLSPSYYEAWRLEADVHTRRQDLVAARDSFQTAIALNENSSVMYYHLGNFLLFQVGETSTALEALTAAARLDSESEEVIEALATAYFSAADYNRCVDTCVGHIQASAPTPKAPDFILLLMRGAVFGVESALWSGFLGEALELMDLAIEPLRALDPILLPQGASDWVLRMRDSAQRVAEEGEMDDYIVRRAKVLARDFAAISIEMDPRSQDRRVGIIVRKNSERHFAFIRFQDRDYFFHHNDLIHKSAWADVDVDRLAAFGVEPDTVKGPRAAEVRVLS